MRRRKFISYFLFTVYLSVLSHTFTPHDHHIHDSIEVLSELIVYDNHEYDEECSAHNHSVDEHQHFPHHNNCHHVEECVLGVKNIKPQLSNILVLHCEEILLFDLTPPLAEIKKGCTTYIPSKIPISFSSAVPLRAPPVC